MAKEDKKLASSGSKREEPKEIADEVPEETEKVEKEPEMKEQKNDPVEDEKLEIEDIKDPLDDAEEPEDIDIDAAISEEDNPSTNARDVADAPKEHEPVDEKKEENPSDRDYKELNTAKEPESAPIKIEKVEKKGKSKWKVFAVVVLTVLVTAAAVLGGVWWYMNKKETKQAPAETKTEETKEEVPAKAEEPAANIVYVNAADGLRLRELPNASAKILATIPFGTKLTILEEQNGWIKVTYDGKTGWCSKEFTSTENPLVYKNTNYGFEITFPQTWAQYKFIKKDVEGSTATYYVALPTTDKNWTDPTGESGYGSLFAIDVYTQAQWTAVQAEEGPKPTKLGEKGNYVFAWSHGQAAPSDLESKFNDSTTIIKTFKIT